MKTRFAYNVILVLILIALEAPAATFPDEKDYIGFLEQFPRYGERIWHDVPDTQLGYFGLGKHNQNQVRPLSNSIFVYALLAADENYDVTVSGVSREMLLEHALAALRYFLATHVTGDRRCTDWGQWGEEPAEFFAPSLISKAVAGARLIWDKLTEEDKAAIKRVVTYEANYLMKQQAASSEYFGSHAAYNAWSGELLAWAASMYPEAPLAEVWLAKAKEYFMNTFSVSQDSANSQIVDGKAISDWVYTTNVHPDFTMEGHGAYQFDYIACPLHSLAWAYYAFVSNDKRVPESLFHHLLDIWAMVKKTHLYRGRFAYLQGKDWARDVYGLYFIMPVLVLIETEFNDTDARLIEQLRFKAFKWEQDYNHDGGVFSRRFYYRKTDWPLIYETDCYANMGMAYLLHKLAPPIQAATMADFQQRVQGSFLSRYCEFLFSRNEKTFISFSWRNLSGEQPMALFVPTDDYMVEWPWQRRNLVGYLKIRSYDMDKTLTFHNDDIFADGFTTTGRVLEGKNGGSYGACRYVSFTGLPADGTAIIIEHIIAQEDIIVTEQGGLSYFLPNYIFNDNRRQFYWQDGEKEIYGYGGSENLEIINSKWLNVDGKLGIISVLDNRAFTIKDINYGSIWSGQLNEEIYYPYISRPIRYREGEVIQQLCFVLVNADKDITEKIAAENCVWLETKNPLIKAMVFSTDKDDKLIVANFSRDAQNADIILADGDISITVPGLNTVINSMPKTNIGVQRRKRLPTTIGEIKEGTPSQNVPNPSNLSRNETGILRSNYPNPFNPETWMPYNITEESEVTIKIYNIRGQLVRTLYIGQREAGAYLTQTEAAHWDGKNNHGENTSGGVYFYIIEAGNFRATRKMLIIR